MSLHSGAAASEDYVPSGKNTSGEKGVEIIANEGNSNAFLEAKDIVTHAHGAKTTHVDGTQTNVVRSDTLNDTWGNARSIFRGSNLSLYFAGGLSYRASASLNVSTSIDLDMFMTHIKFALSKFEMVKWNIDMNEAVFKIASVKTHLNYLMLERHRLSVESWDLKFNTEELAVKSKKIETELANLKTSISTNVQL